MRELDAPDAVLALRDLRRLDDAWVSTPIVLDGQLADVAITGCRLEGLGLDGGWLGHGVFERWRIARTDVGRLSLRGRALAWAVEASEIGELRLERALVRAARLEDVSLRDVHGAGARLEDVWLAGRVLRIRLVGTSLARVTFAGVFSTLSIVDEGGSSGDLRGVRSPEMSILRPASPELLLPCVEGSFLVRVGEARGALARERMLRSVVRRPSWTTWPDDALVSIGYLSEGIAAEQHDALTAALWPLRRETAG